MADSARSKIPHPAALDMLIDVAARTGQRSSEAGCDGDAQRWLPVASTIILAAGFIAIQWTSVGWCRISKRCFYDNAELLKNMCMPFRLSSIQEFARIAKDMMRWMDEWLTDRGRGGFYASQDADVSLDDDGDYFTWTREEAAAVLSENELAVAGLYFDIGEMGDMHHNPKKNVLHVKYTVEDVVQRLSRSVDEVRSDLESAQKKLYAARLERPTPFVDKTVYTSWNALAVSAYLEASGVLQLEAPRAFALKTLDRILQEGWSKDAGLAHVIATQIKMKLGSVYPGVLDDYAFLTHACAGCVAGDGDIRYTTPRWRLVKRWSSAFMIHWRLFRYGNAEGRSSGCAVGASQALQDTPTPAGNLRLPLRCCVEALSSVQISAKKLKIRWSTLEGVVEHFGLYAGTYGGLRWSGSCCLAYKSRRYWRR